MIKYLIQCFSACRYSML